MLGLMGKINRKIAKLLTVSCKNHHPIETQTLL